MKRASEKRRFSRGERIGFIAFAAAVVLGSVDLRLAAVPLTLFVTLCAAAPFLPRAGFFFPVFSRGRTGRFMVALTFDDGPNPDTTPRLLDLLAEYRIPAAFFVTGRRAARYPHLIRQIVDGGHEVGNHSYHHNRYRMFWQPSLLASEILATQQALSSAGIVPAAFRPPVGITTPAMEKVLADAALYAVNFSCRAFDRGNRRLAGLAAKILARIDADDIVLLHDNDGGNTDRVSQWIGEVRQILEGLTEKGLTVVPLSRLINRPVMHAFSTGLKTPDQVC
jgi:peptidoglycan/xylan/chitin deacetylase (PgdA/CDA1 family)